MYHSEIEHICKVVDRGGVILYPTDTVWGVGCDATNQDAVKRVFAVKQRKESKSLIVLVDSVERIKKYVKDLPESVCSLIKETAVPLTIIYPEAKNLAPNVVADDGSIAIRVVKEPLCIDLIRALDRPIVSTSANISGENTPLFFSQISKEVISKMDYVVAYGRAENKITAPSRIIKLNCDGTYTVLRP